MNPIHWILVVAMAFISAGVGSIYPDISWAVYTSLGLLALSVVNVVWRSRKNLGSRQAAFGLNSGITILLVLGIVGVVNFLLQKHVWKWDLTKAKTNTLSDQSQKVVKNLRVPVKAVIFSKTQQEEKMKIQPLFENYKAVNSKFEFEFVDPDKDVALAAQVGVKAYNTVQLKVGEREMKIEDPTEEKITNALIKLTKSTSFTLCAITGHGEKSFSAEDALGYSSAKKTLASQSYEIRELNLRSDAKVPENCSAIAVIGPASAFFPAEVKTISDYLDQGGRAFFALDVALKGNTEAAPEMTGILKDWGLRFPLALMIDPLSRMNQLDASVPASSNFNKDHAITREMQNGVVFPLSRPIDILKEMPKGIRAQWLMQTTPGSWGETDFGSLTKGQVKFDTGKDIRGPLNAAVAIDGKREGKNAPKEARIVVVGTSLLATNQWARFGVNMDLFANSISWLIEDESLISIRDKQDAGGYIELTSVQGGLIFFVTVLLIPLGIAVTGIVVWLRRKRM